MYDLDRTHLLSCGSLPDDLLKVYWKSCTMVFTTLKSHRHFTWQVSFVNHVNNTVKHIAVVLIRTRSISQFAACKRAAAAGSVETNLLI